MSLLHRQAPINPYLPASTPQLDREPSPPLLASDILASLAACQSGSPGPGNPLAAINAAHSRQAVSPESGVSMWGIPTELSSRSAHPLSREEAGRFYFPSSYYDPGLRSYRPALPRSPLLLKQQAPPQQRHRVLSQQEVAELLSGGTAPQGSRVQQVVVANHGVEAQGLGVADVNHSVGEQHVIASRKQPKTSQHLPSVNGEISGHERGMARAARELGMSVGVDPRVVQGMGRKRNGPGGRDPKGKRPRRDTPQQPTPLMSSEDEEEEDELPAPPPLRARPVVPPQLRRGMLPAQPQLVPLRRGDTNRTPPAPTARVSATPPLAAPLPPVASLIETTTTGRLADVSAMYPRMAGVAVRPGSGAPMVPTSDDPARYSESPLPSRHSAPLPEPSRSESGVQGSQSAPSVVSTPSSSSESARLEFGHVRVKKEPGLEDSEPREQHTVRVCSQHTYHICSGTSE